MTAESGELKPSWWCAAPGWELVILLTGVMMEHEYKEGDKLKKKKKQGEDEWSKAQECKRELPVGVSFQGGRGEVPEWYTKYAR